MNQMNLFMQPQKVMEDLTSLEGKSCLLIRWFNDEISDVFEDLVVLLKKATLKDSDFWDLTCCDEGKFRLIKELEAWEYIIALSILLKFYFHAKTKLYRKYFASMIKATLRVYIKDIDLEIMWDNKLYSMIYDIKKLRFKDQVYFVEQMSDKLLELINYWKYQYAIELIFRFIDHIPTQNYKSQKHMLEILNTVLWMHYIYRKNCRFS